LEHVVYALAIAWGVNVNRTTLELLSALDSSYTQLSQAVITYATAIEGEKSKRKQEVRKQLEQTSASLAKMAFDLESNLTTTRTDVPLNVESIVRDIRKQFSRHAKVRSAVDLIINKRVLRQILDIRNDAAHASTSGKRRELSKREVDAAIELLRTALFLFGNVAFAVAELPSS
jgi:hypothetical protein